MSTLYEVLAQVLIVVDLPVEDEPLGAVHIVDRLLAAGDIDDRKAPHSKTYVLFNIKAVLIRPAVNNGSIHPLEEGTVHRSPVSRHISCNAAHSSVLRMQVRALISLLPFFVALPGGAFDSRFFPAIVSRRR